jgi:hypothetical protein
MSEVQQCKWIAFFPVVMRVVDYLFPLLWSWAAEREQASRTDSCEAQSWSVL